MTSLQSCKEIIDLTNLVNFLCYVAMYVVLFNAQILLLAFTNNELA